MKLLAALMLLATATEGTFTGAGGVRLFYRKVGRGRDVVVYVHGGPGSNFRGNGDEMTAAS